MTSLEEGYARAKELTRRHAKSFYFSSVAMAPPQRQAAYALYAFCRRLDDLVDGDNTGDGLVQAPAHGVGELGERLELARASVKALYAGTAPIEGELPWHPAEQAAFRDTVQRYAIPEAPFQELINGMEMDLTKTRYATFEELNAYCHRAAGVVGLMMTPLLGFTDEACLPFAADLGVAMQLTNILRDVREDLSRGRVYLPADELAYFQLTEADLARGVVDARWVAFMRFQIDRARALYQRSLLGLPYLNGFRSRRLVRLMASLYGHILTVMERWGYDVFTSRARVPFGRKLVLAAGVMLTPDSHAGAVSRPLPQLTEGLSR